MPTSPPDQARRRTCSSSRRGSCPSRVAWGPPGTSIEFAFTTTSTPTRGCDVAVRRRCPPRGKRHEGRRGSRENDVVNHNVHSPPTTHRRRWRALWVRLRGRCSRLAVYRCWKIGVPRSAHDLEVVIDVFRPGRVDGAPLVTLVAARRCPLQEDRPADVFTMRWALLAVGG